MSLIICSECGKQVSDKATSCPHCGNPLQTLFDVSSYEIASNYEVKSCSHCGRDIPKKLGKCPYCGKNQNVILGVIGGAIFILMLLSFLF